MTLGGHGGHPGDRSGQPPSAVEVVLQHRHDERLAQLGPEVRELAEQLHGFLARLGSALSEQGQDALLEQAGLALGALLDRTRRGGGQHD